MRSISLTHESRYIFMVEPETYRGSYCPHVVDSGGVLLAERFVKVDHLLNVSSVIKAQSVATTYCAVDDLLHVPVFREDGKA
jgi:hypothetical protein